ncbi:MAG: nucleotidyltransferase domain-containing protein [Flavobacteriales bacterium]|nr:nucleotidyltransferase domain-containing protein [Flavobacteriales bacterium]
MEITKKLEEIENQLGIKILWACETGSRAWGFPSPDSDFDIRLIYVHRPEWYFTVKEKEDHLSFMMEDGMFDITGWELRKSLRLLLRSNPPLLERLQSPIVYKSMEGFQAAMLDLAKQFYSRLATMHHYLSMAKKGMEHLESNQTFKLKSFFYVLRCSVVCRWVEQREDIPPIVFQQALNGLDVDSLIHSDIHRLVELKANQKEDYRHCGEERLMHFVKENLKMAENVVGSLRVAKCDVKQLDKFFFETVNGIKWT